MGSSSDLEILPSAKAPSPVKPRKSGRERRIPRSKDELAAPAAPLLQSIKTARRSAPTPRTKPSPVIQDEEEEEEEVPSTIIRPTTTMQKTQRASLDSAPVPSTSRVTLPPMLPPTANISASSSAPSLLSQKAKSSASPAPVPRAASTESTSTRPPSKGRSATPKLPARKPYMKPPGGDSSDEADDFFNMGKPVTKPITTTSSAPKGMVPGGGGGGRVPKVAGGVPGSSRSSATPAASSPPKTKTRKYVPSSSSDSDDSMASPQKKTTYSSDGEPMTKGLSLPSWTRGAGSKGGSRPGMSGADLAKLKNGFKANRKRRRLSEETDDEKDKGKGKMKDVSEEEEEDSDDSLDIEIGTPKAKVMKEVRPKRPGLVMSLNDDDDDDKDEDDDEDTPGATPQQKPKSPSPKKLSTAQELLQIARGLKVKSPVHSAPKTQPCTVTSITIGSSSDGEDASEQLDPALRNIRSGLTRKDSDFEIVSDSNRNGGQKERGMVTVIIRMVFDPTVEVSPMIKKMFEKEETFEIGINESFASLFHGLAYKRFFDRSKLVIVHEKSTLYEFGTPKALRLVAGSVAQMRGYTQEVWNKVKELEARERMKLAEGGRENPNVSDEEERDDFSTTQQARQPSRDASLQPPSATIERSKSPLARPSSAAPPSPDKNLFRLTVRGSKTQSIDLAVKFTTTMQSLIKAYSKQFGITDKTRIGKMFIEIEGDKVESTQTIQDIKDEFDLEGEETVDLRDPSA